MTLSSLRTHQYNELTQTDHFSNLDLEKSSSAIGWIASMPEEKNWIQFKLKILQVDDLSASGNVKVYIKKDSLSGQLSYGDVLRIDARLLKLESPKNPHNFDFSKNLYFQNIHYQYFVKEGDWRKLESNYGNVPLQRLYKLRKDLLNILKMHLESEDVFAVGAALSLGYRGAISEEVRNAYANTGAIHVLAVSGLHVGIIAMILFWILRILPAYTLPRKCLKAGIALLGIWLFALLTGGSASVIRASIMFSAIIIGRYVEQNGNVYNSLATAAFFSLIVEPYLIFQVGFQLSYLAVIGIVFFQPKIYKLLYFKYKAVDYLWQITSVSIAAQIAVFPISLYYFHQFPTYFWLSSMIVIPAALIVLLLVIFLFVSQAFLPIMSEVGGELLECLLQLMNRIIFAIERLPFGLVEGVWIEWYDILLWYALIIAATLTVLHRKAKFALASALVFCLISGSYTFKKATQYFNKSITIYHSSDGTIIDLFDAQTTYAVHSSKLEKKTLKWVTQQHRSAMGSKSLYTHFLDEEASTTYDNIWIGLPYIQFYDKRIMLLDHNELQASNEKLELDYMIIHANPNLDLEMVLSSVKVKQIIIDASNSQKNIEKWIKQCESLEISCYDIKREGAYDVVLD